MSLDKLIAKQEKLAIKIETLKKRQEEKERKDLEKKKIIIGEYYYNLHEKNNTLDKLSELMDEFLLTHSDRKLFGLAIKEK